VNNNFFFKNIGPFSIKTIADTCEGRVHSGDTNIKIQNIIDLFRAKENDVSFLNSIKYKEMSLKNKATACITSEDLVKFLPESCIKIIVANVLLSAAKVSKLFYPDSDFDHLDQTLVSSEKIKDKYINVKFGKNVLIGDNVQIGKNTTIGNNSTVEHNVKIGENCSIGSFVLIKNSIIENDVHITDGVKIGSKGFGFIPNKSKNFRIPHIGKVLLKRGVEIGSGTTIDRGSISDTILGENTFVDNLVQIGHNVKIGKNCIIVSQVGISGSTVIGDNVVIGGQAGISGHLKIGNNVKIGGNSGVIKDIPDNKKVMGYPSIDFKKFVKKWRANGQ
jgi:UDP-3-O-[3-hydroxymyristoyl] glucosamine N-acyltransferase|tara:strand:- start:669 stop:1667 length:999 start_codon:yes stop_codon:yes gene_type:complete